MLPACQSPVEGAVSKHSSGQLFKGEELASPHTEQEMREAQPRQRAHSDPESHTLASIKKIAYNTLSCFKQLSLWLCYIIYWAYWAGGGGGVGELSQCVYVCAHRQLSNQKESWKPSSPKQSQHACSISTALCLDLSPRGHRLLCHDLVIDLSLPPTRQ